MKLSTPHKYQIAWGSEETPTVIKSDNGKPHFSNPVTLESTPKLYVVSDKEKPIYVGKTTTGIATRLRQGFKPSPRNPYGYLWRHYLKEATIDIWILTLEDQDIEEMKEDPSIKRAMHDGDNEKAKDIVVETLEAEVVLQIQEMDTQWPKYQSEIHFHQSQPTHREIAEKIVSHYRSQ